MVKEKDMILLGLPVATVIVAAVLFFRSVTKEKYVFFDVYGDKITDQNIIDQKIKELESEPLTQERHEEMISYLH
ncbi:MAG: hypothetical protein JWL92_65 [Candidatus Nomurabacteria bacterium]|nr:hypothetical protein [Candidatus Nomurabacteria bacterium]